MITIKKKSGLIVDIVLCVVWVVICLLFMDFSYLIGWVSFTFGLIAFLLFGLMIAIAKESGSEKTAVEIKGSLYKVSITYVVVTVIYNLASIITAKFIWPAAFIFVRLRYVIIINVIILAVFIIYAIAANLYIQRVTETTEEIAEGINGVKDIKFQLQMLCSNCSDERIKPELLKLKEMVDYSDNMGRKATIEVEDRFYSLVINLQKMIRDGEDYESVMPAINEAKTTWKFRNSRL